MSYSPPPVRRTECPVIVLLGAPAPSSSADPASVAATIAEGSRATSMALKILGKGKSVDITAEVTKQQYELTQELHRRFDTFANGLVTVLNEIHELSEHERKNIEAGFAKHQRDEVEALIQTVKERTAVAITAEVGRSENAEATRVDLNDGVKDLQVSSRTLAQKDDRNLPVIIAALGWEWPINRLLRKERAIVQMKDFYAQRMTKALDLDNPTGSTAWTRENRDNSVPKLRPPWCRGAGESPPQQDHSGSLLDYDGSSSSSRSKCASIFIRSWKTSTTSSVSGLSRRIR